MRFLFLAIAAMVCVMVWTALPFTATAEPLKENHKEEPNQPPAPEPESESPMEGSSLIPKALQVEHGDIHAKLVEATRAPGKVGEAARKLAGVLHPHFVREEEIALPPLGMLQPLSAGGAVPEADLAQVLAMTDSLKAELPRMLEEHRAIKAAVEELRKAALAEGAAEYARLADDLALHAQTEEEVLYPAAILVGEVIRARTARG